MQTHIQALFNPGTCVLPEELKLWCHEAYAAGAKGLIYWMWRPFTKGLQTLGRGIVNYRTVPTERYGLVKEMSEELFGKYGVITPVRSKVGVLYHELSDDLSRKYACYNTVDSDIYVRSVFGAYKAFMDIGDYDKVWQYSAWDSNDDSGYNAEAYYQFMSDVILYLCSTGNKAEANTFLNHYVYWFDVKIDNSSEYSTEKPQFMCDIVRGKLQRIINTY
jgi:hypothetical protein